MMDPDQSDEMVVQRLETGTAVRRFSYRHRPESGNLKIRRDTHHLLWSCSQNASDVIITSLGDIKEVRPRPVSKDFEKWAEETRNVERTYCFVVFYGKEFKLRSLSIAAISTVESLEWVRGINYLREEYAEGSYIICLERFLRTEFYSMKNNENRISFRDVKAFLLKINLWTSSTRLKELFDARVDQRQGEIFFDQFVELIMMITWDKQEDRKMLMELDQYSEDKSIVTMQEFQAFLVDQHEQEYHAANIIKNFVSDLQRDIQEPYFRLEEFFQYLFSKSNEVWNRRHSYVGQDMSQPLSHYWIASSHNTYLTGDQLASDSSVEAYARALRQGCRCIELDCWDGPKDIPIIYHGHTLTSKIGFKEVLEAIHEHAFVTSSYPLILSLENHCSLPQQKEMARLFKLVFGSSLLTAPIENYDERGRLVMPSPDMLKGKIMLKYRKLPGGTDEFTPLVPSADELGGEQGLDQVLLNDRLYLKNPVDPSAWQPHLFFLSQNGCLSFTEAEIDLDMDGDDLANDWRHSFCDSDDERHLYQTWYHGKLAGGREKAQELLQQYSYLGDGTFLVRLSENFIGDHTLSFWNQGKPNHCRIKTRQEGDRTTYRLRDTYSFPNLYTLIEHYRVNPIRAQMNAQNPNELSIVLRKPVPRPNDHECMEWYHPTMTKEEAEEYLGRIQENGAFLVRPSQESNFIAISFRAQGSTKHCRVKQVDQSYLFGTATFENLVDLVKYYKREPLYRHVKLRYPVTKRVIDSLPDQDQMGVVGQPGGYITCIRYTAVKAKFNYTAQNSDELTFPRHAIIHNVNKVEENWWKGDYGGSRQYWFPAIFVEDIQPENINEGGGDTRILGDLQKGNLDLRGSDVAMKPYKDENPWNIKFIIRLTTPIHPALEIGCVSEQKAREWLDTISSVASTSTGSISFQQRETRRRIDKDLSDLVVYFQSVDFDIQRRCHNEVSSFPETKMMSQIKENPKALLEFHKVGFSRVYPKSTRVDSSNYNPMPMWNHGCQLVSLNYQTGDKSMQVNEGMFLQNGKCGYVLRPKCQMDPNYDPSVASTLQNKYPFKLEIKIFGARHLINNKKGCISPMVELEIIGCDYDSQKISTRTVRDNGLNPVWGETMHFDVMNPECAVIRFVVNDVDSFGDLNQIGQATYPVLCLRGGFRSVPLKNNFSEEIELASLLIYLKQYKGVENPSSYVDHLHELHAMKEEAERNNNHERASQLAEAIRRLEISMRMNNTL